MQSTETKEQALKALILKCADFSGYDEILIEPKTEKGIVNTLSDIFHSEKSWEIKNLGSYQAATNWFQGLCSACSVPYWNDEIENLGFDPETYFDDLGEIFTDMINGRL